MIWPSYHLGEGMNKAKVLFIGAGLLLASGTAFADGGDPPAPPPAGGDASGGAGAGAGAGAAVGAGAGTTEAGPAPKIWVGGGLEMLPIGTVSVSAGGQSQDQGTDTGVFGLNIMALYQVHPMVAVGLAPRYIFNIKGGGSPDSASMYDIRAVAVAGKEVAPKIHASGMLGLGYASITLPDMGGVSSPSPAGLTLSFGAMLGYAVSPKLQATASLSYELGFEGVSVMGVDASEHFNHAIFGVGILAAIK
jgi:hypothetical protein